MQFYKCTLIDRPHATDLTIFQNQQFAIGSF